jgi:putative transposase
LLRKHDTLCKVSIYIHKSHNVSVLLYHLVCVAKYRQIVFDNSVDKEIKNVCLEIAKRYEIHFVEIGTDKDHIHFLIQSVPTYSPTKIARIVKSITAKEVFKRNPGLKEEMWGGGFWTDGYFINTVGRNRTETAVLEYIKKQGNKKDEYIMIHKDQLKLI